MKCIEKRWIFCIVAFGSERQTVQPTSANGMFSGKDIRRFITEMQREQRFALQLGTLAMVLLPTIFIATLM